MDKGTEIASGFTVGRYQAIRKASDLEGSPDTHEWREVFGAFRRRLDERFLRPIAELEQHDKLPREERPTRAGFAILTLDCLLIDTIQSFREGRVRTGEISTAATFKEFLKGPNFSCFASQDRDEFFQYVRNGLLHNGETRRNWRVRIDMPSLLVKDPSTGMRTLDRSKFHHLIVDGWERLCTDVESSTEARKLFLRRTDAICGLPISALENLYFAYGSNLLDVEIKRDAKDVEPVAKAFLPRYRLEFTKHAASRAGDAANIRKHDASIVWGFVYRLHDNDRERLVGRAASILPW